jgi:fatty-acyl-CoA synthase
MAAQSLIDWLGRVAGGQPQRPAAFAGEEAWTYGQLWDRSERLANGLLTSPDFAVGRRIGLLGPNGLDYLAAYLGILRAGGVVVPLNDRQTVEELGEQLEFVDAAACIVIGADRELTEGLAGQRPLRSMAELDAAAAASLPRIDAGADATILLTSGSTGSPKGVRHTHATLFHAVMQMAIALPFSRDDVSIAFLPFFAAIPEQVLPLLAAGGALDILETFDVEAVCRACDRGTTFDSVPTIMARLLDDGDYGQLNRLRWISFASEPMPPPVLQRWWERIPGPRTHEFYGMTEMLTITHASPTTLAANPASVGIAYPSSKVEVVDEALNPLDAGEEGEVTCASPARMPGYLDDEEATQAALTPGGAIRTGDQGRFDEAGRLVLTGRLKDLIISGGFNIAPAEIEAVACRHPQVAAAAAVGIPDERWGETPVVVGVPAHGNSLSAGDLLMHCRTALNGYKRPSGAAIVTSLPVTGIGKSAKARLRQAIIKGEVEVVRAS